MAVQPVEWGSPEILEQNRQNLLKEYRRKLREYETRYEMSSAEAEEALSSGRLRETAEVCDWMIAHQLYRSLQNGR